jgi:hypothetical protein
MSGVVTYPSSRPGVKRRDLFRIQLLIVEMTIVATCVATNLARRLEEHRQCMVHHTARYNIHRLIYGESHATTP